MIAWDELTPDITDGWYNRLASFAVEFAAYGGKRFILPPHLRTSYVGPNNQSLGYDPVKDLDWGQWEALRGGTAIDARRMVLSAARQGVRTVLDPSLHQYGGAPPYVERNGSGVLDTNLGFKPAEIFGGANDTVFYFDPNAQAFGVRCKYEGTPGHRYLLQLKTQALNLYRKNFANTGVRFDASKDMSLAVLQSMDHVTGPDDVAEVYDGSNRVLGDFCHHSGIPAFDFGSMFAYRALGEGAGLDCLRSMDRLSLLMPGFAWHFVTNHDTDQTNGVRWKKRMAYFDALTMPSRMAVIYSGDWNRYGLASTLRNYMWVHAALCAGPLVDHVVSPDLLIYSRNGDGGAIQQTAGVICGMNNSWQWQNVWIDAPNGWRNCWLENYTVAGPIRTWVEADGRVHIPVPPCNAAADNSVALSLAGQGRAIKVVEDHVVLADPKDFSNITVRYQA